MVGSRRGRPSLLGRTAQTAARTAVIAGTATAVSGKVAARQAAAAAPPPTAEPAAPPPAAAPAAAAPGGLTDEAIGKLQKLADLRAAHPDLELILIESGGDNLAATFSPELADLTIYVIDTAAGQDIPRKRGPGLTRSDLLVVNKTDLAPHVGVDAALLESDARVARGERPLVMAQLRHGRGVAEIVDFLVREGGLVLTEPA